jgi:hypothetical protein
MFTKPTIATLFASLTLVVCTQTSNVEAKENLFSEISMADVFDEAEASANAPKPTADAKSTDSKEAPSPLKSSARTAESAAIKSPSSKLSLVGTWSALISDSEAFALAISPDRQFRLAWLKDGKTKTSQGIALISDGELTLSGEDEPTISGTIKQSDHRSFVFGIKSPKSKVVLSLKFKRDQ